MQFQIDQAIEILERTPQTFRALLEGLSEPWLTGDEGPDTFNPYDVLGHLIDGEQEDWIPRLEIILEHGKSKPFEPFDRFAFKEKIKERSIGELLETFENLRRENLAVLARLNLRPSQYELNGSHPELGSVTVGQLIATWAAHDLGHLGQIARVLAKQYQTTVGPWKKYLSILHWGGSKGEGRHSSK